MSKTAIRVEGLGKQYQISSERKRYRSLRDEMSTAFKAPFKRAYGLAKGNASAASNRNSEFWALRNVSFEVEQGDVVGIIGHNGAGKSTLLKILSRITEPTEGRAQIFGRVGALLEVGTGFHTELTGRENIYLNGAILGMSREEIRRKFDEIVAFAEVEKFIDTPVKHYSSGMGLRLGFAVAVHLEPEILVVDEVLAVGDAEFQKKCLTRMQQVSASGRTILFVSHNMSAVRHICQRALVLRRGQVAQMGEVNAVVDQYLAAIAKHDETDVMAETPSFVLQQMTITTENSAVVKTFDTVDIRVKFMAKVNIDDPGLYVGILTLDGLRVTGMDFKDFASVKGIQAGEQLELGFRIEQFPLLPGTYQLECHLKDMAAWKFELVPTMVSFDVVETPVYGGRKLDHWFGHVGLKVSASEVARDSILDSPFAER